MKKNLQSWISRERVELVEPDALLVPVGVDLADDVAAVAVGGVASWRRRARAAGRAGGCRPTGGGPAELDSSATKAGFSRLEPQYVYDLWL